MWATEGTEAFQIEVMKLYIKMVTMEAVGLLELRLGHL